MTNIDAIALLHTKDQEYGKGGRTRIANELGYSPTVVTQMLKTPIEYTGNVENVCQKIIEVYGNKTCTCPVLGEIPLARCSAERKKGFSTSRVDLWKACQKCERGTNHGKP